MKWGNVNKEEQLNLYLKNQKQWKNKVMTQEEKSANYARERLSNDDYPIYNDEYEIMLAFEAGAEWQKEQIMKNAISMDVYYETEWDDIHKFLRKNLDGEKVKLLIIKEE